MFDTISLPKTKWVVALLGTTFGAGVVTLTCAALALAIGAVLGVACLLNFALLAFVSLAGHIGQSYQSGDSFTQFLIIVVIGFTIYKLFVFAWRAGRPRVVSEEV
jgi:hypothetical protein